MSFDFNSLEKKPGSSKPKSGSGSKSKPVSKSSNVSSSGKSSSGKSAGKTGIKRGRSASGIDQNTLIFGGVGGGIILITIVAALMFSGSTSSSGSSSGNPSTKRAHLEQANRYTNQGDYQKAIKEYEKAYKLDPSDSYASDQISIIYRNNLHDEAQAERWKQRSYKVTSQKKESMEGSSAAAYAEKQAKQEAKKRSRGGR